MERGILYVETQLSSPELAEEFHRQYDEIHINQMLGVDGIVGARRYEPHGHEGPFVAIYDIEAESLDAARQRLASLIGTGRLTTPVGVVKDPPPVVRYFREITRR